MITMQLAASPSKDYPMCVTLESEAGEIKLLSPPFHWTAQDDAESFAFNLANTIGLADVAYALVWKYSDGWHVEHRFHAREG